MKHIHKQAFLFIAVFIGIALSGCKKFLDVNKDPNRATDETITAELIFPAAAEGAGATAVGARASQAGAKTGMQWAQSWVGYMAANGDFARDQTETTYNLDATFADNMFQTRYGVLFDLHQVEVKALAGDDAALAGAAIILSAKGFQELVDMFGNIPYSEAFQDSATTRPAYDKAQDIYQALQGRLDQAIGYLSQEPVSSKFAGADIVNHGVTSKWIKFANTLKLRLLIRQSEVSGFDYHAEIDKIFGTGSLGILGPGESVSVNPGYSDEINKQSPFYANYGYTAPPRVKATTSTNANDYIVTILSSTQDPRLGRFFTPVTCGGTNYVGDVYGDEPGNIPAGAASSYFGPALVGELGDNCAIGGAGASQDQWILPSYESMFFKAEAIARGWTTGDAQTALNDAITESFVWLKVDADSASATTYISNNPDISDLSTAGSATEKAQIIAFQKYLANVGIDPLESYSDQRRLNFLPAGFISKNPSAVSTKLPLRLPYPQSEKTSNGDNLAKEGTIDIFSTKIFWQP